MGAVHGVYLKYVGLSAISYAGYVSILHSAGDNTVGRALLMSSGPGSSSGGQVSEGSLSLSTWRLVGAGILGYSALLNGSIAVMFKMARGMKLIGKDSKTGSIPLWSYILYFPFHIPTIMYTYVHMKKDKMKKGEKAVPMASEVQPGWYVGGRYADELNKEWAGIVDLTVEFPERCISQTQSYKLVAVWDGVPPDPATLDDAAQYAVTARQNGNVLVHCAHGRGRSTTVMCACLVKAGMFDNWRDAFEKGIKPGRKVCKLNSAMRKVLTEWQRDYVDGKKGK
mmetsp:Transcript_51432/g.61893  ORF Transcript_51432/g.61893 Transcript_51432/m.61893 type:complete len:282 (-) Transcript_51432:549-1394(-)